MENLTDANRNSFVFYRSYSDALSRLKDFKKKYELLMAIIEYGLDMREPEFDEDMLALAWVLIKPTMDANHKNYLNGRKGGAPVGNQNAVKKGSKNNTKTTQKQPKTTENNQKQGNDNDNDNANANVNANANANANVNANHYKEKELKEKERREPHEENGTIFYPLAEGDEYDDEGWEET